jgi:hypothetical protein
MSKNDLHFHIGKCPCDEVLTLLTEIKALLGRLVATSTQEELKMAQIDDDLDALTASVAAQTTVIGSAKTAFTGLQQQLADAIAAAKNSGATPAQLAKLEGLNSALAAETADLAAAIPQSTPAA